MKKIVPIVIVIIAALVGAAGGVGARLLASPEPREEIVQSEQQSDGGGSTVQFAGHGNEPGAQESKKAGHEPASSQSNYAYVEFNRQFVAPIVQNGSPIGLMIMDITFEVEPSLSQRAYAAEPKLRDAVLRVLLQQSSSGRLDRILVEPTTLDQTKAEILAEAKEILGAGVISVLIMDVGYQHY